MFCLANGTGENHVGHSQQPTEVTAVEMLQDTILIPDRPERPNLVKHDNERTVAMPFPLQHAINEPARIAKPIEPIRTVLNQHGAVELRQSFTQLPSATIDLL